MIKNLKIIFALFLVLVVSDLKSQSLELVSSDVKVFAKPDEGYANSYAIVKNISNANIEVKVKSEPLKLEGDHTTAFCLGDQTNGGICYPPSTGQTISTIKLPIAAGAVSKKSEYNGQLFFGTSGTSSTRYTFFNAVNSDDKVSYEVTWIISPLGGVGEEAMEKTVISLVNAQNDMTLNVNDYLLNRTLGIYNSYGQLIQSVNIKSNQVMIDTRNYISGNYFINIEGIEKTLKFSIVR